MGYGCEVGGTGLGIGVWSGMGWSVGCMGWGV